MRPLLKWAGGKRQLLATLRPHFPDGFNRYIEPFLGSGAVFFDLYGSGTLNGRPAVLADGNIDLIGCYQMVRDRTEDVITALESLAQEHRAGGDAFYYEVRDGRFNALRLRQTPYTPALAAML
ncbi:MAG: DNA adenine methylase, partial [Acidobacteriota bacterium]